MEQEEICDDVELYWRLMVREVEQTRPYDLQQFLMSKMFVCQTLENIIREGKKFDIRDGELVIGG